MLLPASSPACPPAWPARAHLGAAVLVRSPLDVTSIVLMVWIGAAVMAYQMVQRVLFLQANLLGALREGDYSIRGTGARAGSASIS